MSRNQLVFGIIIIAALIIVGIGLATQGGSESDNPSDNPSSTSANTGSRDPLTLTVAVNTVLDPWITPAVEAYNRTSPRVNGRPVTVTLTRIDSLSVWGTADSRWTTINHPLAWIPEASYALDYARDIGLNYTPVQASLASTPIIWGVYQTYHDALVQAHGNFDAEAVHLGASAANWQELGVNQQGYLLFVMSRPDRNGAGWAGLYTLAADYANDSTLSAQLMGDAALREWLEVIINAVPNFSTLGANPAQVMATRGISAGQLGLLPESQWLTHYAQLDEETLVMVYPDQYVLLDFPLAVWNGAETTADERRAVEDLGRFLLANEQQRQAGALGFRPAANLQLAEFAPFSASGVQLELAGTPITPPARPDALNLLRWFSSYRTAP